MPPSACSNRPMRCLSALVNAPFSCPNSSDSSRFSWSAAQLTFTNARLARSRVVVNRAGDELLARARFAADENRRVAARDLLDDGQHLLQRAARAHDAVEVVDVLLLVAQVIDLVLEVTQLDRLLDLELHLLDFERLLHEVERADLHRLDRRVDRPERRHEDDGRARLDRPRRPQHVHAVGAAHAQVGQHHVELAVLQPFDRDRAVGRLFDVVAGVGQRANEALAQRIVIVNNQNASHPLSP